MYRRTKKLFAAALVLTMLLTMTVFQGLASAATTTTRLGGNNRYETAANVATEGWKTGANTAVVVRGDDSADALVAAPLAKLNNAPILLTASNELSAATKTALTTLGVKNVIIVGGTSAVSAAVEDAIKAMNITVERVKGDSRYATSVEVAKKLGLFTAVALANAYAPADALSISSIAAAKGMPILFTDKASLPTVVKDYLADKNVKFYLIGGTGVIADGVVTSATRLGGDNRYATNRAVLNGFADVNYDKVFLATSEGADALAGSALAAKTLSPIVLVDGSFDATTKTFVEGKVSPDTEVVALGGTTVVPAAVVNSLVDYIDALEFKVKSVTSTNLKEMVVTFTQNVNMADSGDNFATSALNPARYNVNGAAFTVSKVDSKSVLVSLDVHVASGATVGLRVSGIKDAALKQTISDFTYAYIASDAAAPTVKGSVNLKTLNVEFSEPMAQIGKIYVAGVDLTSYAAFTGEGKTATIVLPASFEAGKSYKVTVIGATDLASKYLSPNPYEFTVTLPNDQVKPYVASVNPNAAMTSVRVTYSEALGTLGTVTFKDLTGATLGTAVGTKVDSTNYDVTLPSVILTGYNYRYIDVTVAGYKDVAGNAGDTQTLRVLLVKDLTAPTYTGIKVTDDYKYLVVNFSEVIAATPGTAVVSFTANDGVVYTAETVTGTITNKDGGATGDLTALRVRPTSWLNNDGTLKAGTYTVKVLANAVADVSAQANKNAEVSATVAVGAYTAPSTSDTTAPTVTDAAFVAGSNVVLQFTSNEDLATPSVGNFTLDGNAMPYGTKVYLYNNRKTVMVEIPYESIGLTGSRVLAYTVSDLAGNKKTTTVALNFVENVRPYVTSALLINSNDIVVKVSEGVNPSAADFEVYVNGSKVDLAATPLVLGTAINEAGTLYNTFTLKLKDAVSSGATVAVKVVGTATVDGNSNPILAGQYTVTRP